MTIRKGLWQEPLGIFTLVAIGIFVLDALRSGGAAYAVAMDAATPVAALTPATSELGSIVVDDALVASLQEEYAWLEGSEPTPEITGQLVEEWISDELVFRHALLEQMHISDAKLREHLIEKVRLLWAGSAEPADDRALLAFYMENLGRYRAEPRVSFEQVFFEAVPEDPAALLATLNAGGTVEDDGYWMGDVMDHYAESILKTSFGGSFYNALQDAPLDTWTGPLASPRGTHFVKVTERLPSHPLAFADIHDRVASDYESQQLLDRVAAQTLALRDGFRIVRSDLDE